MNKSKKTLSLSNLFVCLGLLNACAADTGYCDNLKRIASDKAKQQILINWVSQNINRPAGKDIPVLGGGGMWPGNFYVNKQFEWSRLGMSDSGQIRLIGVLSDQDGKIFDRVVSVYFGDRSRKGILVKVEPGGDFGVSPEYLSRISDRIAVVCRD